ncbi:hypothetical protein AURDEDRAFT_114648 [Auricularia subglabra TFB-10046 SS5]|nr:hypothetical protein AURDEDRAFT_114648 [Auricularia subglabra TFB-10046 SS5]
MSYDSSLLAHAPQVTKAEHQEGYNVDILNHREPISGSSAPTPTRTPQPVRRAPSPAEEPRKPRLRFWQTTGGRIALAVLALVVVGAIVGGAVGGTAGRHKKVESQGSGPSESFTSIGLQPTQGAAAPAETTTVSISTGRADIAIGVGDST